MTSTLIDTNVVLDLVEDDESWSAWSGEQIRQAADIGPLVIDPIIFAEVSMSFSSLAELNGYLADAELVREPLPWEAAFEAGKAHAQYRDRGGARERTRPDFFIGAHAAVKSYRLLTRDPRRYRRYFPTLKIIAPDTHP